MKTRKKIKSILFILVLILICLSIVYGVDVNNSLAETESAIEVEPQEIKKPPFPPETAGPEYAPDEILVKFKPGVKRSLMAEIHARFGMVKIREIRRIGVHRLRIPAGRTVSQMVREYRRNPNVEYAEPNYVARKYAVPDDPYYINQWAFYQPSDADIDAQEAWDIETGTPTIIIAIIDDGIDYNHGEFPSGKLWINPSTGKPGYDYGGTVWTRIQGKIVYIPDDDVMHESATGGHGTCTAGIASAATDNGLGIAGTSWNATIMPLKVEDGAGDILYSYLADAITFAADNGAHILSMSLGGTSDSASLRDACGYAWDTKGKVLLASSGNENTSVSYPAAYSTTIAVGATNESDERCTTVDWGGGQGSNYGPELDVVAPGNNIYAPDWSGANGYVSGDYIADFGGTSASCPMAAGLAALILSQNSNLTNIEVRYLIRDTAEDLVGNPSEDTEGLDNYYGYGRINAYYALLGGPPLISKIVFTTPPRSVPVNSASEVMTIQTQDSIGSPIAVSSDTAINLFSTSDNGRFSLSASPWADIIFLTIDKGKKSASFYYKDSTVGTPTITVSESPDAGWIDATQEVNITFSQPDLTLTGTADIEFSNQTPEPFEVITISATIHNNGASYHNQNIDTTPFAQVTSGGGSGYLVDITQWDGQSFTATSDGWMAKVSIAAWDVNADVTDPERFFRVRIQGDDNGKPDGNDLSSVESYDFAGSTEWHDFVFSRPARIVSGAKYWIVANSLAANQNGYAWRYRGAPDAYEGGGANVEDTADSSVIWGTESSKEDFWFKTYTYTYNTLVQFYDGDPDNGGIQISSDQSLGPIPSLETDIASVNWTAVEGSHEIYVHVDRPNYITESDDTNNKAYRTITVGLPPDTTPPAAITNLTGLCDSDTGNVTLYWSTPGDDGWIGTLPDGSEYRIDYSTYSIQWSTTNYKVSISTSGVAPYTQVSHTITGLTGDTTWYFQIWTADEVSNWSGLSNGATVWVNSILSVSVESSEYDFETMETKISSVSVTAITVTNTGNVTEIYSIKCSSTTKWTPENTPGENQFTLQSAFHPSQPENNDLIWKDDDILTESLESCTTAAFSIDGTEHGKNVPPFNNNNRNYWFRLKTPLSTGTTYQQTITVTITAGSP